MTKTIFSLLIAANPWFVAHAASELYYDSQGFENLATSFAPHPNYGDDVSRQSVPTLHPATAPQPQPDSLFDGATIETLKFNDGTYQSTTPANGTYALGMMGSPVGTPVYPVTFGGVVGDEPVTTNYDALYVPIDVSTCPNITSVTINFDLSLSALFNRNNNLLNTFYYDAVPPAAIVKLFDATNVSTAFNTALSSQAVTGSRSSGAAPSSLEWMPQTVTLSLTPAMLSGTQAYLTLSGSGSAEKGQNTYIGLDNVVVYRNTPPGTTCTGSSLSPASVPTSSPLALLGMAGLLLGMGGLALRRRRGAKGGAKGDTKS